VFSHAEIKVNSSLFLRAPSGRSGRVVTKAAPRLSKKFAREEDSLAETRTAYQRVSSTRPMHQMRGRRLRASASRISRSSTLLLLRHAAIRVRERKSAAPRPSGSPLDAAFPESVRSNAHGPRDYVNSSDPGKQRAGLSGRSPALRDISNNGAARETRGAKHRGKHNSSAPPRADLTIVTEFRDATEWNAPVRRDVDDTRGFMALRACSN